jgi:hypothetical protein
VGQRIGQLNTLCAACHTHRDAPPSAGESLAILLLCASSVLSRFSGGNPSSLTSSLSDKSMQSNWFCEARRVSWGGGGPKRLTPRVNKKGRFPCLCRGQVLHAAQLVTCGCKAQRSSSIQAARRVLQPAQALPPPRVEANDSHKAPRHAAPRPAVATALVTADCMSSAPCPKPLRRCSNCSLGLCDGVAAAGGKQAPARHVRAVWSAPLKLML